MNAVNKYMQARLLTKNLYEDLCNTHELNFVSSTVSFDASRLSRGHKSKFGFASVIDFNSGYLLDFDFLSKYCHACALANNKL